MVQVKKELRPDTIKTNLKKFLLLRDWTPAELDRRIGKTGTSINNVVRGASKYPTIEIVQRMAHALNIEISQLLYEEGDEVVEIINHQLLLDCFNQVTKFLHPTMENKFKLNAKNILNLVGEVYQLAEKLNMTVPDDKFIEWVVSKYYY